MYVDGPHVRQGDKLRADVRTIRYVVGKREGREKGENTRRHMCIESCLPGGKGSHVRLTTIWATIMFMIHALNVPIKSFQIVPGPSKAKSVAGTSIDGNVGRVGVGPQGQHRPPPPEPAHPRAWRATIVAGGNLSLVLNHWVAFARHPVLRALGCHSSLETKMVVLCGGWKDCMERKAFLCTSAS